MMEKSPFLDFIENFKMEHGINLIFDEEAENDVFEYAEGKNMQMYDTLNNMLFGATVLGFLNIKGSYHITKEMLRDKKYFDRIFTEWYQKQKLSAKDSSNGSGLRTSR